MIGVFRSDISITCKIDGNFGNVSTCVLFSKVVYQRKTVVRNFLLCEGSLAFEQAHKASFHSGVCCEYLQNEKGLFVI